MAELISLREYGRRRGVSDTAVRKAITAGKIVAGLVIKKGKKYINPEIADTEWSSRMDPSYQRKTRDGKRIFEGERIEGEAENANQSSGEHSKSAAMYANSRAALVTLKAKKEELELKKMQGSLVDRQQVYKALFAIGQEIRTELLHIPDRHIAEILACTTEAEAHLKLTEAIARVLEKLSNLDKRELTTDR